jgi:hypothetical protein
MPSSGSQGTWGTRKGRGTVGSADLSQMTVTQTRMKANSVATLTQDVERRHGGDNRDKAADDELAPLGRVLGGDDVGNRLARQDALEIHDPLLPFSAGTASWATSRRKVAVDLSWQHLATGRRSLRVLLATEGERP